MTRLLTVLLLLSGPALAQDYCGPTWQMRGDLRALPWEEAPLIALTPGGDTGVEYELWVNLDSGTWTMLETDGRGRSCIIGVGSQLDPFLSRQAG